MGTVRRRMDPNEPSTLTTGWIDEARVEATSEGTSADTLLRTKPRPCKMPPDLHGESVAVWA